MNDKEKTKMKASDLCDFVSHHHQRFFIMIDSKIVHLAQGTLVNAVHMEPYTSSQPNLETTGIPGMQWQLGVDSWLINGDC